MNYSPSTGDPLTELTVVTTAQQLWGALAEGALHIEILDNFEFTTVQLCDITNTMRMLKMYANDHV